MQSCNTQADTFQRVTFVADMFGVKPKTIWSWTNPNTPRYRPDFPKPIKLSGRATAFSMAELAAYQDKLKACRTQAEVQP